MIVTTGNEVVGAEITKYVGIVRGIIVRSPSIAQGFFGGLKQMIGGADCHRKTIGKCKQPLGQPADDSKYRRIVRRRLHSACREEFLP